MDKETRKRFDALVTPSVNMKKMEERAKKRAERKALKNKVE